MEAEMSMQRVPCKALQGLKFLLNVALTGGAYRSVHLVVVQREELDALRRVARAADALVQGSEDNAEPLGWSRGGWDAEYLIRALDALKELSEAAAPK